MPDVSNTPLNFDDIVNGPSASPASAGARSQPASDTPLNFDDIVGDQPNWLNRHVGQIGTGQDFLDKLSEIGQDIGAQFTQGSATAGAGTRQAMDSEQGAADRLGGAAKAVLGSLQMIGAPFAGPAQAMAGDPLRRAQPFGTGTAAGRFGNETLATGAEMALTGGVPLSGAGQVARTVSEASRAAEAARATATGGNRIPGLSDLLAAGVTQAGKGITPKPATPEQIQAARAKLHGEDPARQPTAKSPATPAQQAQAISSILRTVDNIESQTGGILSSDKADAALKRLRTDLGIPATMADLMDYGSVRGLAGVAARSPTASAYPNLVMKERYQGTKDPNESVLNKPVKSEHDRLVEALHSLGGMPTQTVRGIRDQITKNREDMRPEWKAVESNDIVSSPRIYAISRTPEAMMGVNRGIRAVVNEAANDGVILTPSKLLEDFRVTIKPGTEDNPEYKLAGPPTVKLLTAMKVGLGKLFQEDKSRYDLALMQRGLVDELDRLVPGYPEVRGKSATEFQKIEAMKWVDQILGGKTDRADPLATGAKFASLDKPAQEAARVEFTQRILTSLMDVADGGDMAKKILKTDWVRQQIRPLFPSDKAFNNFTEKLSAEVDAYNTRTRLVGGSPTAERTAADANSGDMTNRLEHAAAGAIQLVSPYPGERLRAARNISISMFGGKSAKEPPPEVKNVMARILFSDTVTFSDLRLLQKYAEDQKRMRVGGPATQNVAAVTRALGYPSVGIANFPGVTTPNMPDQSQ